MSLHFWCRTEGGANVEHMPEQRGHLTVHLLLSAAQAHKAREFVIYNIKDRHVPYEPDGAPAAERCSSP